MQAKLFPCLVMAALFVSVIGLGYSAKVAGTGVDLVAESFAGIIVDLLITTIRQTVTDLVEAGDWPGVEPNA